MKPHELSAIRCEQEPECELPAAYETLSDDDTDGCGPIGYYCERHALAIVENSDGDLRLREMRP